MEFKLGDWCEPTVRACDNKPFLRSLEEKSVKLIVTSPPYNIGKEYERRTGMDRYVATQREVLSECLRVLHPEGSICWQVGNYVEDGHIVPLDAVLYPVFRDSGLVLRNRIIWHFGHGLHCVRRLSGRYETVNWWTRPGKYTWNLDAIRVPSKYPGKKYFKGPKKGQLAGNPLGKNPSDYWACDLSEEMHGAVWEIPNVKHNHVEKEAHPCQFPVELVERLVLSMTNVGDRVCDPYMGVGSAVIAAAKNHRRGYGCDINSAYVDIARRRIEDLRNGRLRTRPMGRPVYTPPRPSTKGLFDGDHSRI